MKVEMTQKVNINRSVWGLVGGNTKNNDPIEPTLISRSFLISITIGLIVSSGTSFLKNHL